MQQRRETFAEGRVAEAVAGGDKPGVRAAFVGASAGGVVSIRSCGGLGNFNIRAREAGPRGEPFSNGTAGGGLVIYAEVDRVGVLKEQKVPERAGAVFAVDTVGVAGRVYLAGLFA